MLKSINILFLVTIFYIFSNKSFVYSEMQNYIYKNNKKLFQKQPEWGGDFAFNQIENQLEQGKITKLVNIAQYLDKETTFKHEVYLAYLDNGLIGVFKPEQKLFNSYGEIAAYKASRYLNLDLIPPTILKNYKNQTGSFQFFIKNAKRANMANLSQKQISDMNIFYFVFGQTDTNMNNQLMVTNSHNPNKKFLVLIDNSFITKSQNIIYGMKGFSCLNGAVENKNCPFHKAITIIKPKEKVLKNLLKPYLPMRLIESIIKRTKKQITYIVDNNIVWMQKGRINYTNNYYKSTLDKLRQLSKASLRNIWREALLSDKKYFNILINLILERKDQVLRASRASVLR